MDWTEVISNLGFPIAVAAYFIWNETKGKKRLEERIRELEERDITRSDEYISVIAKNTMAMHELSRAVDVLSKKNGNA